MTIHTPPPVWSTACLDWEERIVNRQSLIPFAPLFQSEADHALDVFKSLRIGDMPGKPTFGEVCEEWVFDFVAAIFGANNPDTTHQLISEFFLCISKKNSKSTLAAGIMLTALIVGWRTEEELLILAPTIEVAGNSFKPAAAMVRADPQLDAMLHVQDNIRTITHRVTKSSLKVVAADTDTVSGKKSGRILIDELWVFGKRANADAMLREATGGLVSRPEGFVIYLTTQSDAPPAGVFKSKLEYARDVRDGRIKDNKFLAVLYEFPEHMLKAEKYLDPRYFYVTNPNLNKSVSLEWLEREMIKEMASDPKTRATFLAKHLNVEIDIGLRADRWAGAEFWSKATDKSLTYETLLDTSEIVCVGIDGGGLDDLFGICAIGRHRETKRWQVWAHAYAHNGVLERRKAIAPRLRDFAAAGELTIVDDELKDLASIIETVEDIKARGLLATVAVDPAGLGEMIEALADIGVTQDDDNLYASPQGYQMMNAIKTAERKLVNETMVHAPSKLMDWCVGNLKIEPTATAIRATKQTAGDAKIDPAMAMFNAVGAMVRLPEVKRQPTYDMVILG
jgi:phage terminase large subunit-like protein